MARRVVLILFLAAAAAAHSQSASEAARDYDAGRALEAEKRYDEAEALYRSAEAKDPANWRYSYYLGELLLGKSEKYEEAMAAFGRAWDRGYRRGITRHKQGMCLWHLGRLDEAMERFKESVTLNLGAMQTATGATLDQLRYQTADSFVWMCKVHDGRRDYISLFEAATEGLRHGDVQGWLQGYAMRSALHLGHEAFGGGDYGLAVRWYELSLKYTPNSHPGGEREWDDYPDWRVPTDTLIELARRRMSGVSGRAAVVHRILALVIMHQDVSFVDDEGRPRHVVAETTPTMVSEARKRLAWLREVIYAMSDGRMAIEFIVEEDHTPYVYSGQTRPDWVGDREILYRTLPSVDTVFRLWPYGEGLGTGGAGWIDLVPGGLEGPVRGMVSMHTEHSHGLWLHEFFHVVERMAGISPTHGYYDESRGSFPGWKGRKNNQLDYFWWHFRTTLPTVGWQAMGFRDGSRYVFPSYEEFKRSYEEYLKIPMDEREGL